MATGEVEEDEAWQDEEAPVEDGDADVEEDAPAEEQGGDAEEDLGPPMIHEAWNKKVVNLRQKLKNVEDADRFIAQLTDTIDKGKAEGSTVVFEDFDISQNPIPTEQLESIFSAIADGGVHVERFRAFGCATLDDAAATLLAGWLAGVTEETAPYELHLSDCAVTTDGYKALVQALEENDTFPTKDPRNSSKGKLPLYIRLEHNFIDPDAIQASIDAGSVMSTRKAQGIRHSDTVKMRLISTRDYEDPTFQQKTGEPPPPTEWPAPRPVKDFGKGKGASKGKSENRPVWSDRNDHDNRGWRDDRDRRPAADWSDRGRSDRDRHDQYSKGYDSHRSSGDRGRAPWQSQSARQALSAPARDSGRSALDASARARPRPRESDRDRARDVPRAAPARGSEGSRSAPFSAFGGGRGGADARGDSNGSVYYERENRGAPVGGGSDRYKGRNENRDNDRRDYYSRSSHDEPANKRPRNEGSWKDSRTVRSPARRPAPAAPRPSAGPRGSASGPKPPWEEHFSEEYSLPYYWNKATGESSWEKPR